ncbi:hypothetical protein [Methylocucumis oryzae]|uniref:hypothetical protein n=1 Tax=Methylocucumis oryzae TaxID=1632867 RepID=UPI0019554554|nr:hypothetical protein [Methylocucumis oryzae]
MLFIALVKSLVTILGTGSLRQYRQMLLLVLGLFFTAKDIKMAEDCDYGLMVWDAESTGTLNNAIELLKRKKISLVYINKVKKFLKIKEASDLEKLVSYMSDSAFKKADKKLNLRGKIESFKNEQISLF